MPVFMIRAFDSENFEHFFVIEDVSAEEARKRLPYDLSVDDYKVMPQEIKEFVGLEDGGLMRWVIFSRSSEPKKANLRN